METGNLELHISLNSMYLNCSENESIGPQYLLADGSNWVFKFL